MTRKTSYLTIVLFILGTFSAIVFGVETTDIDKVSPAVMTNEPSKQADSEYNQDLVSEHPINVQRFIVNVEKIDDYVISIMIDSEIRRSAKSSDTLSGFVSIYNNDTGVLLNNIELSSSVGDNTLYEFDNYLQGPILRFHTPKKGNYLIVPVIKTRSEKISTYSLYFSRVIPTKSFFN